MRVNGWKWLTFAEESSVLGFEGFLHSYLILLLLSLLQNIVVIVIAASVSASIIVSNDE